jgi:hypothetical protein
VATSRIYYPQARTTLNVVFDGFGPTAKDTPPKIIDVIPVDLSVQRNAYNQADGWEVTFDADDFPIDPRLVRSGASTPIGACCRDSRAVSLNPWWRACLTIMALATIAAGAG